MPAGVNPVRSTLVWTGLVVAVAVPITAAAASPLLAYRDPVYIVAGLAGVVALALMLMQPLLAAGYLPGLPLPRGRTLHRLVGAAMVAAVIVHVAALWMTSPPDVVDALLFRSPTPFSVWGVVAMWAVFAAAATAALRRRWRFGLPAWRSAHTALAAVIVIGTVVHALLIEGTMEPLSKAVLCLLVLVATVIALADLRNRANRGRRER